MKRYFTLLLLLLALAGHANEEVIAQAGQHYMNQEFEQAIQLYEQVLASGKESAQVYYNLGNAYFKTGDMPKALLNYERAKLLAPGNEDIDFNIRIARQNIVDNIEPLPQAFFVRWWNGIVNQASADRWATVSIVLFFVALVLLAIFFFSQFSMVKRITFWFSVATFAGAILTFSFASQQKKVLNQRTQAIVFAPRVTVKSSPASTGTDLFLIHEGLKVEITDSLSTWKEIRIPDGNKGWLPDSTLVRI
ncbi:protein containing TPR repeat [Bacteroidales bacterium 6E]|nr:protein containing TPR repeat [Bacteroidales bacterium 6E]